MRYPPRALFTGFNLTLQCLFDDILLADPHRLRIFTANENFSEKVTMLLTGLSTLSASKNRGCANQRRTSTICGFSEENDPD